MEEKKSELLDVYETINSQADLSALPEGIDGVKLRKMLDFTSKGLMTQRFLDASFQPEMLYEEIAGYLDMMKQLLQRVYLADKDLLVHAVGPVCGITAL